MLISDIPTHTFNLMVSELRSEKWKKVAEYDGFDAWIDYGMVVLKKSGVKLKFEWDNWFEGSVRGPDVLLQELQKRYKLK